VAGTPRVAGWKGDGGPAHDALLHSPVAEEGFGPPGGRIALDGDRLFVADTANHAIRVVDLTTGLIHAVAGRPDADDFHLPSDVAVAPDGALIVADTGNHCIRRVDLDGSTRTLAGRCGEAGFADGPADDARFFSPFGVAVDDDGAVWVADTDNHLVRRIGPTDPGSPD
jgi:DNA-binding beta-propeller fold protein YncE